MNTLVRRAQEDQAVKDRLLALTRASSLPSPFPQVDLVFPLLHGPFGEDGTARGLLEMARAPYVGAGVPARAPGMGRGLAKKVFREHVPRFEIIGREARGKRREEASTRIGIPGYLHFVNPANGGSRVEISPVTKAQDLLGALDPAFRPDLKAGVEEATDGRGMGCRVLGNDGPRVSLPDKHVPLVLGGQWHELLGVVNKIDAVEIGKECT